mmetsp:Transcript_171239/g.549027  ORF Transcript_171239/g.549027 Transcript_171239/m.549027 type:complete len:220 (-) Transcript_171239:401-1060(-)
MSSGKPSPRMGSSPKGAPRPSVASSRKGVPKSPPKAAPPPMAGSGRRPSVEAFNAPKIASMRSGSAACCDCLPTSSCRNVSTPGQIFASAMRAYAALGSPRPRPSVGKEFDSSNIDFDSPCAWMRGTSPLNTSDMSSAMGRWLSNRPFAPPASKAAAMRRKVGSLCSSASKVCWMMLASFFSKVFTPQIRLFFLAPPASAPSAPSSSCISAELRPPKTL